MPAKFVWLASYPRSGNTWMRMMLRSLHRDGGEIAINSTEREMDSPILSRTDLEAFLEVKCAELTEAEIADLEPGAHRFMAANSAQRILPRKVHDCCWKTSRGERVFPPECSLGAVYMVRDPRDVAVSFAHFMGSDLQHAVDKLADPGSYMARSLWAPSPQLDQPMGTWSHHVTSWLDDAAMPVLLVRYEDTLADAAGSLRRVAAFMGLASDAAEDAARATAFDVLRRQEDHGSFRERPPRAEKFFRSGTSGDGRKHLSAAQLEQIETTHGDVMRRLGYL